MQPVTDSVFHFSATGHSASLRRRAGLGMLAALVLLAARVASAQEERIVQLSNGMVLGPGILTETGSISTSSFQRGGSGEVQGNSIWVLNDNLRKTYFNRAPVNVLRNEAYNAPPLEEIVLPNEQEAAKSGNPPAIRGILGVSAFNKYGRRNYAVMTPRGPYEFIQGITVLTPKYMKLAVLNSDANKFVWDSREATNSIPPDQLRAILNQALDLSRSGDWLNMVSFYMQAERYQEARDVLVEAMDRFRSELADRKNLLGQLDQLIANQKFEEIKLRQRSGQRKLAAQFLGAFPVQLLPLEAQVKLNDEVAQIQQQLQVIGDVSEALKFHVGQLPAPDQQFVSPIVDEILGEISFETVARLADFQRLRTDDSIPNENKVALALSGWLLGVGGGLDNFAVVKSVIRVRANVLEYLNSDDPQRRQALLTQLRSEEGAEPPLLQRLLETMKPPHEPPAALADDPPGLHRLQVTTSAGEQVDCLVQVPPEYDPNRKYPCILALPGKHNLPELEINAWAGPYQKLAVTMARSGYATRYGYIVVSPNWMTDSQPGYEYTEQEQSRILTAFRESLRTFSIDTDRVFVAGHFDGATAAWDLAVSHPDLWAGALMISPGADKYIVQYHQNVRGSRNDSIPLGTYIVYGDSDINRFETSLGTAASKYVESSFYDSLVVEYQGRGSGLFLEEMPRMFEWMELSSHRRKRTPQQIDTKAMRPGDRFFYWLEAPALLENVAGNPFQFDPANAGNFEATLLDQSNNGVRITRIPSPTKSAIVWFTPDMVDFTRPILVSIAGRSQRYDLKPDIAVMLEDVRTRADRMHIFWQQVFIQ